MFSSVVILAGRRFKHVSRASTWFVRAHSAVAVAEALSSGVHNDAEDGEKGEDGIHEVQELLLQIPGLDNDAEEPADFRMCYKKAESFSPAI